jgi:hypothetical protein
MPPPRRSLGRIVKTRSLYWLVGAAAMLVPAALVIVVFPTAMGDLSENFATGRWFPLTTPEHPPLQVWMTGLTGLIFPPGALSAVLVNQAFNALGVLYVWLTLRRMVDPARAALFALLFAGTIWLVAAPLSYALNADAIQLTIWAGAIYHLVRATETNRPLHWLGFGLWLAAALYAKYSALILIVGLAVGSLVVPDYRRQWANPRFWLAVLLSALLVTPYFVALAHDPAAVVNAEARVDGFGASLGAHLRSLLGLAEGLLLYLAPGWVLVAIGLLTRDFSFVAPAASDPATIRFTRWTFLGAIACIVLMIAFLGLLYLPRFDAPLLPLAVLAGAPLIALDPARWPRVERQVLFTVAAFSAVIFAGAAVAYTFFTAHDNMQEPFAEADAIVRADWAKTYACGPAYYLGDRRTAHGLSISGDLKPIGVPIDDLRKVDWFDPDLLRRQGGLLVFSGADFPRDVVAAALPEFAYTEPKSFTLPLLRTRTSQSVGYSYAFVPPADCPAKAAAS